MSYYKICPWCGAHLDPGEICDCRKRAVCPGFLQRFDHKGQCGIDCAGPHGELRKRVFWSSAFRDESYGTECCGSPEDCYLYRALYLQDDGHGRADDLAEHLAQTIGGEQR